MHRNEAPSAPALRFRSGIDALRPFYTQETINYSQILACYRISIVTTQDLNYYMRYYLLLQIQSCSSSRRRLSMVVQETEVVFAT